MVYANVQDRNDADLPVRNNLKFDRNIYITDTATDTIINAGGYLDVLAYGLKNDGVTDNTATLQTLLNNNPGRVFYFPAGNYKFTNNLTLKKNTTFVGDGLDTIFDFSSITTDLELIKAEAHTSSGSLLDIFSFNIFNCKIKLPSNLCTALLLNGVSQGIFQNLWIENGKIGIFLRGETNTNGGATRQNLFKHIEIIDARTGIRIDGSGVGSEGVIENHFWAAIHQSNPATKANAIGVQHSFGSGNIFHFIKCQNLQYAIRFDDGNGVGAANNINFDGVVMFENCDNGFYFPSVTNNYAHSLSINNKIQSNNVTNLFSIQNTNINILSNNLLRINFINSPVTVVAPGTSWVELDRYRRVIHHNNSGSPTTNPTFLIKTRLEVDAQGSDTGSTNKGIRIVDNATGTILATKTWSGNLRQTDPTPYTYITSLPTGVRTLRLEFIGATSTENIDVNNVVLEAMYVTAT